MLAVLAFVIVLGIIGVLIGIAVAVGAMIYGQFRRR